MDWFTNHGTYRSLLDCFGDDAGWAYFFVAVKLGIAMVFSVMAAAIYRVGKRLDGSPARIAILLSAAVTGMNGLIHGLSAVRIIWPAYRLQAILGMAFIPLCIWLLYYLRNAQLLQALYYMRQDAYHRAEEMTRRLDQGRLGSEAESDEGPR